jgi:hypothetical protein
MENDTFYVLLWKMTDFSHTMENATMESVTMEKDMVPLTALILALSLFSLRVMVERTHRSRTAKPEQHRYQ